MFSQPIGEGLFQIWCFQPPHSHWLLFVFRSLICLCLKKWQEWQQNLLGHHIKLAVYLPPSFSYPEPLNECSCLFPSISYLLSSCSLSACPKAALPAHLLLALLVPLYFQLLSSLPSYSFLPSCCSAFWWSSVFSPLHPPLSALTLCKPALGLPLLSMGSHSLRKGFCCQPFKSALTRKVNQLYLSSHFQNCFPLRHHINGNL